MTDSQTFEELRKLNKTMSSVSDSLSAQAATGEGSQAIGDDLNNNLKAQKIKQQLLKSDNKIVRAYARQIKTMADVEKIQRKSTNDLVSSYEKISNRVTDSNGKLIGSAEQVARSTSKEMHDLGLNGIIPLTTKSKELEGGLNILHEKIRDTSEAFDNRDKRREDMLNGLKERAKQFGAVLLGVGKEVYNVAVASAEVGGEVSAQQILQSRMLGMSQEKLIRTQAEYRQVQNAAGMSTNEFSDMMQEGANATLAFTGSLERGAIFTAQTFEAFKMFGGTFTGGFTQFNAVVTDVTDLMNDRFGVTAERMGELNSQLIMNQDVQAQLFKMDKSRRTEAFLHMQQERLRMRTMGLNEQQAEELLMSLAKATGSDAKDRLQNAAKLEASLGAMGMGAEAREAADILRKGSRASTEEQARLADILKEANDVSSQRSQGTIGQEMVQDFLNGLTQGLVGGGTGFGAATVQSEAAFRGANTPSDEMPWMTEFKDQIIKFGNIVTNFIGEGGLDFAKGAAIFFGGKAALSFLASMAGAGIGGAGKGAGKAAGLAKTGFNVAKTAVIGGIAILGTKLAAFGTGLVAMATGPIAVVAGSLAAAAAAGVAAGTLLDKAWAKWAPESYSKSVDIVGGTLTELFSKSIPEVFDDTVSHWSKAAEGITDSIGRVKDDTLSYYSDVAKGAKESIGSWWDKTFGDGEADKKEQIALQEKQVKAQEEANRLLAEQNTLQREAAAIVDAANKRSDQRMSKAEELAKEQINETMKMGEKIKPELGGGRRR